VANPSVVTQPTEEPITLQEAKDQLRIDFTTDDTLIAGLIATARRRCEVFCNRRFVTTTLDYTIDAWPNKAISLPGGTLQSITSITYTDSANSSTVLDSANYFSATKREPGAAVLAYGYSWPSATLKPAEAIVTRYITGYGAATDVPDDIKHGLLLYVTHLYKHRGDMNEPIPMGIAVLLWPHRVVTL
jgi:uncharacterized phiE125 gp8 family phage protein